MIWIGLTGSIGSGKSSAASLLKKRGFEVIDADHFAREALAPGGPGETKVLAEFGAAVRGVDGRLDRSKLAAEVFNNPKNLKRLEAIVHPLVREQTEARRSALAKRGCHLAFYDVPLLFEKKMESQFDAVVVVYADVETCIRRVMARNSLSREQVEARVRAQLAIEDKIKKAHWTIHNDKGQLELETEVDRLLQDISRKFPKSG